MASVSRVQTVGDNLVVFMDDGTKLVAYGTNGNQWLVAGAKPEVNPTPTPGTQGVVSPLPTSLNAAGVNLNAVQIQRAAQILSAALKVAGNTERSMLCSIMTAYTESTLHIYSNTSHYPETANYPHDANGSDNDSVGLFQQRPVSGWGTPQQCMDAVYSTRAFLGGTAGPNYPSPRGLFDIPGWATLDPGTACQRVQGSAFPARYAANQAMAQAVLDALLTTTGGSGGSATWQWPFQYSRWVIQGDKLAQFGPRIDPVTGKYAVHEGLDFGASGINGQPIPVAADGHVDDASYSGPQGNHVHVTHAGGFATWYFHMNALPPVNTGDTVTKGQIIGHVGATGWVTGPHLHWETHVNGTPINPRDFMKARGVPES